MHPRTDDPAAALRRPLWWAALATLLVNDHLLKGAGLRPTRQRVALASLLFARGNRHISAELLHEEAMKSFQQGSKAAADFLDAYTKRAT